MLQGLISLLGPGAQALEIEVKDNQELSPSLGLLATPTGSTSSKVTQKPTLFC